MCHLIKQQKKKGGGIGPLVDNSNVLTVLQPGKKTKRNCCSCYHLRDVMGKPTKHPIIWSCHGISLLLQARNTNEQAPITLHEFNADTHA